MAATAVQAFNPLAIAGLGRPLERADMNVAQLMYNDLPNIRDQPRLQDKHVEHVKALLKIIELHGMGGCFGVHAAHRHDTIPTGTIRFEADMGINGFTWTRPTAIENPDPSKIHATFFKFVQDDLVPFEFAKGPSPVDGIKIPAGFLPEFGNYLAKHELTNLIALEVGDFAKRDGSDSTSKAEVEIQWGQAGHFTVVLPVSSFLKLGAEGLVATGWNVPAAGPEPEQPDPGTHWARVIKPKNTHKVFVDSTEPVTPDLLVQKLVEQGIIDV